MSGGLSGLISITIGYFVSQGSTFAQIAGLIVCLILFIVFCWRSAKTLFTVLEMTSESHPDLRGKAIAFLIISLMAVVTITVLILQLSVFVTT